MKKFRNWIIGDYLAKTYNVFEKAKIELTYSYAVIFILLGLLFYGTLIANHLWYHFYIITFGLLSLFTIPLILKYRQDYRLAAKVYLIQQFIVSLSETLIQGAPLDIQSGLFNIVVILFAFFVYGTKGGFLASLPFISLILLEATNSLSGGVLVNFHFSQEQKLPEQPILVLMPLALNIFVIWKLIATRNVAEKQILEQKSQIEIKSKEITDSITYAKRIQQAMLPKKEEIYASFPNSFILFKPKDIVSGDFYYFNKLGNVTFIAAADCTGHGVPGAFMSMIGSEKLDKALAHTSDTSEILAHLNKGIKSSLKQSTSDDSTRDGMDIALCSVDTNNLVVKYAGANRSIWIIRNGKTEVEEIKATKKAIGGFTDENQHYDTHEIKLHCGDTFYISTDGYADTFSAKDKKLTSKRFKQILLGIQDKPMQEQEQHLDSFIENWKTGVEQVDDILVIGVRL
jgi:serine phosphatase RsbU (regulator of sigma subunit)